MPNAVRAENLRLAIAGALAESVKAYDLERVCVSLGLDPANGDDPSFSKRVYVKTRLVGKSVSDLMSLAHQVIEEYGDVALEQLVGQLGMTGVSGEMKNIIFAANGPKPRIVLRDAINNVIEITDNEEYCLVYDRPLSEDGLSWRELTAWWAARQGLTGSERDSAASLYRRLDASLANDCERLVFRTYRELYGFPHGFDMPALIPQVYLHYDPYTRRERAEPGPLSRQRMDFLLLLPSRQRIVIEVDGQQHYADPSGAASPARYAGMVREDRALRLAGYEVYRFGGKELMNPDEDREAVRAFFQVLMRKHSLAPDGASPG